MSVTIIIPIHIVSLRADTSTTFIAVFQACCCTTVNFLQLQFIFKIIKQRIIRDCLQAVRPSGATDLIHFWFYYLKNSCYILMFMLEFL